jgi:hypothetical protein
MKHSFYKNIYRKMFLVCFVVPSFGNTPGAIHWGTSNEGFQLGIGLETNIYPVGAPIVATVVLVNASDGVLNYTDTVPDQTRVSVTDEHQKSVMLRKAFGPNATFQEKLSGIISGSHLLALNPGEARTFQIDPTVQYELNTPGKYYITVSRFEGIDIISDTVGFTIVSTNVYKNMLGTEPNSRTKSDNSPMPRPEQQNGGTNPQSLNLASSPFVTLSAATSPSPGVEQSRSKTEHSLAVAPVPLSENNAWRDKFLLGTLCFLFLVLALIFYRAHRRSVRQQG